MADQPQLDLPAPEPAAPERNQAARRRSFAGLSRMQLLAAVMLLIAAVWAMWVTKAMLTPKPEPIVSARLSSIVGDYVQAQARSAAPPAQVEAEMRKFMATLDGELQRRSEKGQIVLVGEAVLTRNVPDITESLKSAVYAAGVARPREASAAELQMMQQQAMAQSAAMGGPQAGVVAPPSGSMAGPQLMPGAPAAPGGSQMPQAQFQPQAQPPAASVSTFGGPNGNGGQ